MTNIISQLQTPFSAIVFDCDGTLSTIEGIDELAKNNHSYDKVHVLTQEAMGRTGMTMEIYQQRLNLVRPSEEEVTSVGHEYVAHLVPDTANVIRLFHQLGKTVYIVSAGLFPAVALLAGRLRIPTDKVFAVKINFDPQGNYLDFDHTSPLCRSDGKRTIVAQLMAKHKQVLYVGDGLNDVAVKDLVTRFVGFGGAFYRENIASLCEFYIKNLSMSGLLPLSLTQSEIDHLSPEFEALFCKGLQAT